MFNPEISGSFPEVSGQAVHSPHWRGRVWHFFKPMKGILFLITITTIIISSCEKREDKMIRYTATDATSEFSIQYRDESGELVNEQVPAESALDKWEYRFMSEQGEIVYLSGKYEDPESALKLIIYIDGKVYKQGSSVGDTVKYLTVSGTVPY